MSGPAEARRVTLALEHLFDCQADTPTAPAREQTRRGEPDGPPQRSFGGTSYSSQTASQTLRTGSPASIASTALRPPSTAKTWSRARLWARIEPN